MHAASQSSHQRKRQARLALAGSTAVVSLFLAACAPMPVGPMVAVMPAPNKPFDVFMQEDQLCRGWAAYSIGLAGNNAGVDSVLSSTATGTAIGAFAGALAGGEHSVGSGAALGAIVGATAGVNQSGHIGWNAQRRYDIAYQQCMYSKGNQLPVYGPGYYRYVVPPPASQPPAPTPAK